MKKMEVRRPSSRKYSPSIVPKRMMKLLRTTKFCSSQKIKKTLCFCWSSQSRWMLKALSLCCRLLWNIRQTIFQPLNIYRSCICRPASPKIAWKSVTRYSTKLTTVPSNIRFPTIFITTKQRRSTCWGDTLNRSPFYKNACTIERKTTFTKI